MLVLLLAAGVLTTKPPVVELRPLSAWSKPPMSSVPGAGMVAAAAPPSAEPKFPPAMFTFPLPAPLGSALATPSFKVPAPIVVSPAYVFAAGEDLRAAAGFRQRDVAPGSRR